MARRIGLVVLVAFLLLGLGVAVARAQQVPVPVGTLTPDCPFGICPATDKPRTASDFYQLFGYLPEPYASQYKIRSTPPPNWPTPYYTPKRSASPPKIVAAVPKNTVPNTAPKNVVPTHTLPPNSVPHVASAAPNAFPPDTNSKAPAAGDHAARRVVGPTGRTEAVVPGRSPAPVAAPRNAPLAKTIVQLTPENTQEMKRQLDRRQAALLDDLAKRAGDNPEARQAIQRLRDAVQAGKVTGKEIADAARAVQTLPAADRQAALNDLGGIATNQQVRRWLDRNAAASPNLVAGAPVPGPGGRLGAGNAAGGAGRNPNDPGTGGRLGMSNAAGGAGGRRNPNDPGTGGRLGMGNVVGGAGRGRPAGGLNLAIGLVPGLPAGLVIPLGGGFGGDLGGGGGGGGGFGDGPALVGLGQPGDEIMMGTGDPAQAAGLPVAPPDATPAAEVPDPPQPPAATSPSANDSVLLNGAEGPISYLINDHPFTLQPQKRHTLPAGTNWIVTFDRGNGTGNARFQLAGGAYEFRVNNGGWELVRKSFETTIANTGIPAPFGFLFNDQPRTVSAGESQRIGGTQTPIVEFDDGSGEIKRRLLEAKSYRVALNSESKLDLYPADQLPATPTPTAAEEGADPAGERGPALPPGFKLFDPAEAISNPEVGAKLPPAFSLFREISEAAAQEKFPPAPPAE